MAEAAQVVMNPSPISDPTLHLPSELLAIVFRFVREDDPDKYTIFACSLVCSTWATLSLRDRFHQVRFSLHISSRRLGRRYWTDFVASPVFPCAAPCIRSLELAIDDIRDEETDIEDGETIQTRFANVLSAVPQLQTLDLFLTGRVQTLPRLYDTSATVWRNVTSLSYSGPGRMVAERPHLCGLLSLFPSLSTLILISTNLELRFGEPPIDWVQWMLPKPTTLVLDHVGDDLLDFTCASPLLVEVQSLRWTWRGGTAPVLFSTPSLPKLEKLEISFDDDGLSPVSGFPLTFKHNPALRSVKFMARIDAQPWEYILGSLRTLPQPSKLTSFALTLDIPRYLERQRIYIKLASIQQIFHQAGATIEAVEEILVRLAKERELRVVEFRMTAMDGRVYAPGFFSRRFPKLVDIGLLTPSLDT